MSLQVTAVKPEDTFCKMTKVLFKSLYYEGNSKGVSDISLTHLITFELKKGNRVKTLCSVYKLNGFEPFTYNILWSNNGSYGKTSICIHKPKQRQVSRSLPLFAGIYTNPRRNLNSH